MAKKVARPGPSGVGWVAGAHAQIELSRPRSGCYQLKYTSPFRSTLRPPPQPCSLGKEELEGVNDDLNRLVMALDARTGDVAEAPALGVVTAKEAIEKMAEAASILFDLTIPRYIVSELRQQKDLFLEIGLDEGLLGYPWELMHDGEEYVCLKHRVGRFVNASTLVPSETQHFAPPRASTLAVLLVCVPTPQRQTGALPHLSHAEAEAKAIVAILAKYDPLVKVEALVGPKATYSEVRKKLQTGNYHIVHYCGHASFDDKEPKNSCLSLYDKDMRTGSVVTYFTESRPVLCFINGCETAETAQGKDRLNVYGLAQAFLETGAYLLGTRWKVSDSAAAAFATTFYDCLIKKQAPLGEAVRDARLACRKAAPHDFAWASYVFYGDPRVRFRK